MNETHSEQHPVDALAEEFVARYRKGERPSLTEYVNRYPELAEEIRDLFPALVMMEDVRPASASGPAAEAPAAGTQQPERVGDYRILREVGRGGMGVVYEAEQESLGRHVAIKVLPAHALLDPKHLQRFEREARAAARLHHTNIVPVFGVGEDAGLHYYVMQFIQGQSLDQVLDELKRLRKLRNGKAAKPPDRPVHTQRVAASEVAEALLTGRFSLAPVVAPREPAAGAPDTSTLVVAPSASDSSTAVHLPGQAEHTTLSESGRGYWQGVGRIGVQVAEALAHAHGQGVLHRDIKPSNLLLDTHGTVWVTDFGLAKSSDSDGLTQTGDIVGTLRYMAPERFQGKSDARSDLYGLGVTLYELLTLRPAFAEADRARLVGRVLREEPPRPRRLSAQVPRDLETIVLKAIAKEPTQRYATAAEMAEDLRRFLTDRPVKARRASPVERLWRWCRRNPALASALGAAAVLLVTVAVVSTVAAVWLKAERDHVAQERGHAQQAERKARLREAEALVGQAHGTRLSRRPGQRFEALDALSKAAAIGRELHQPPEWFDRLRNEAIAALALPDVHITQEFGSFPPGSVWVELSDDFELYVRTTDKGSCTIRRVADDAEVAHLPELGERVRAAFGAGRLLAVHATSSKRFQLWDLSGAEPVLRFEESGDFHWMFRNDGRLVALSHTDGSISVYDTASGKRVHRLAPGQIVARLYLELHPTEPLVACYSYLYRDVQVRDLRSGAVVAAAQPPWPGGSGAYWSPDGRTLTVASGDIGKIQEYAFDPVAPALRPTRTLESPSVGAPAIVYNPAGDRFVSRGWGNSVHLFDSVSGQQLFATHSLPAASDWYMLRFDRTGQRLAAARVGERSDRIGLWSVADGREYRYLVHTGNGVNDWPPGHSGPWGPAIHPGGRLAALGWIDGVALFDLETGHGLRYLPIRDNRGRAVGFDGTGSLLTNGFEGCFRWPVRSDSADPGRLFVGPPVRLPFAPGHSEIAASHDGRVIAQCMWAGYGMAESAGGWILHPHSPAPRRVAPGVGKGNCGVSPDGRWVAFGGPDALEVFDASSGQRVWQSPAGPGYYCRFSPDRRWLAAEVDGGRLYAAGAWEPGPQLGPGTPWDVTTELAVLGQTNGIYRLVEMASGRELARLEAPDQNTGRAAFTPDGTKLVILAKDGLRIWDLRRIRAELAKLGLDWDGPPYSPAAARPAAPPLRVTVDMGQLGRK
jgi:serine/threonine protein kinase/WD40 repeat protein